MLNLHKNEWVQCTTNKFARHGHSANLVGDEEVFIFGGRTGRICSNDLSIYNIKIDQWYESNKSQSGMCYLTLVLYIYIYIYIYRDTTESKDRSFIYCCREESDYLWRIS